jgi:outer membrane immunogenic protein
MKKFLLSMVSVMALTAPVAAADLPPRVYSKAPPPATTVYDWSGLYVGANGGWGTSHNCWTDTLSGVARGGFEGCNNASGETVGGQIGYRWQTSAWVFGVEAQGNWADFSGSNTSALFGRTLANTSKIDAFGLFTGQIGYAVNNALFYVKGGGAVTSNKFSGAGLPVTEGCDVNHITDFAKEARWGSTVGAGAEYGFAPNWSVGLEYDHLFMGRSSDTFTGISNGAPLVTRSDSISQDVDMVTARINYRFGPVASKY